MAGSKEIINVCDLVDDMYKVIDNAEASHLEVISAISSLCLNFFRDCCPERDELNKMRVKHTLDVIYDRWIQTEVKDEQKR